MNRRNDLACCSAAEDGKVSQKLPLHVKSCKRGRSLPALLVVAACSASMGNAMVTTSAPTNAKALLNQARFLHLQRIGEAPDDSLLKDTDKLFDSLLVEKKQAWTETLFDDMRVVGDEVTEVQELQRSTGSEIPNEELQLQIEQGKVKPEAFLDAHVPDSSHMEKVAMSSIPQQLPRPALAALTAETQMSKKMNKKRKQGLDHARGRVSQEEELELARQIQRGVKLHKLKTDFEAKHGREISRAEWTELAKLESPKELRRQVVDYRRAKQLLVEANMGLVHAVVKTQFEAARMRGYIKEELVQEGSLGLLRAAELFDPSRGLRFSTYATIWIKGMLSNSHLVEQITVPQREKTKWNKICKAHDDLAEELQGTRDPTPEEISKRLNMSVEDIIATKRKMTHAQQVLSLDYEYKTQSKSGGDTGSLTSLQNDKAFMADVDLAERTQLRADVVAALAQNLDAREARLMRLRYGLSDGQTRSIHECADAMGLSKSRAQQLATRCLKKLREAHNAESLQEYLLTIA